MSHRSMTIRVLEDFLKVPADDLGGCLRVFREKIEQTKLARADAQRLGVGTVVPFNVFEWSPNTTIDADIIRRGLKADTPLSELGLRPSAISQLRELQIYCIEDCAEASQSELQRMPDIGRITVLKIREYMNSLGLDFKENSNPVAAAYDRARLLRKEPLLNRKTTITDDSEVAQLGLRTATFSRCLDRGLDTVGKLRSMTPRDYIGSFGTSSCLEIAQTLESIGLTLHCNPSQLELWLHGMRLKEHLLMPEDDASVIELQPWLGAIVYAFKRSGVATINDLKLLVRNGQCRVRGVGKAKAQLVADFFHVKPVPEHITKASSSPHP